jgi:hypothetical protein
VKKLLAQRVPAGHRVHEKQGLLFSESATTMVAEPAAPSVDAEPDDGGNDESPAQPPATTKKKKGTPRKPGKIDTAGLPSEDRLHDVPEEQRIDPATGKPLVKVGEAVFEELDYQRAQLRVIRHVQPIYGLPPEEQQHREVAPVKADLPPRPLERCAASVVELTVTRTPSMPVATSASEMVVRLCSGRRSIDVPAGFDDDELRRLIAALESC